MVDEPLDPEEKEYQLKRVEYEYDYERGIDACRRGFAFNRYESLSWKSGWKFEDGCKAIRENFKYYEEK